MVLSFPIGAYLVFNSEIGDDITYEYPMNDLNVFLAGVGFQVPVEFELGDGFIVLWCLFLILFGLSNLVLFGGIYWSKFAHMFYKPGAAIQKRLAEADGSNENLPYPTDKPKQFGLGIKREEPKHY